MDQKDTYQNSGQIRQNSTNYLFFQKMVEQRGIRSAKNIRQSQTNMGKRQWRYSQIQKAQNKYYCEIQKAKKTCWQSFLQREGKGQSGHLTSSKDDANRCWTALKYTNPQIQYTTPALKGTNSTITVTTEAKKALIRAAAFFKPSVTENNQETIGKGNGHQLISQKAVQLVLYSQLVKKAPGPDKLNFRALRLLWDWDAERITYLIQYIIWLQYHPKRWRLARGILLQKPNKPDYELIKAYQVISLLNCLGKVVEKVVAEALSLICKTNELLPPGKMGGRKKRCAVDVVAVLVHQIQTAWNRRQFIEALFMDVKETFDHVSRRKLVQQMKELNIDNNWIGWTKSFLAERRVELVIDGSLGLAQGVDTGIPQGSPVSPILFLIYISGVFETVETASTNTTALSFVDDLGFLATGNSIQEIAKVLQKAEKAAVE